MEVRHLFHGAHLVQTFHKPGIRKICLQGGQLIEGPQEVEIWDVQLQPPPPQSLMPTELKALLRLMYITGAWQPQTPSVATTPGAVARAAWKALLRGVLQTVEQLG